MSAKKEKPFKKLCFIGTQKQKIINIKIKVQMQNKKNK